MRISPFAGIGGLGDCAGDELLAEHPIAEGSIPDAVVRHLLRDTASSAMLNGGDPMLMMRSIGSMARGSSSAEASPELRIAAGSLQLRAIVTGRRV